MLGRGTWNRAWTSAVRWTVPSPSPSSAGADSSWGLGGGGAVCSPLPITRRNVQSKKKYKKIHRSVTFRSLSNASKTPPLSNASNTPPGDRSIWPLGPNSKNTIDFGHFFGLKFSGAFGPGYILRHFWTSPPPNPKASEEL